MADKTEQIGFRGVGIDMIADAAGPPDGPPILFLHGSGQTRHSWRKAVLEAARRGYRAITLDLRGHGNTDWSPDHVYSADLFVADIRGVVEQIGGGPALVGASIGGLVSMVVAASPPPAIRAAVLVDIAPIVQAEGVAEVRDFMANIQQGFATIDEAADAVAAFMPHRPRPKDTAGLARNLRLRDGRYYWHWDPAFHAQMAGAPGHLERSAALMKKAAQTLVVPTLLVRGGSSAVVSEEGAKAFLALVPHAEHVDIAGARHMVAGDANDMFNDAVFTFLDRHRAMAPEQ